MNGMRWLIGNGKEVQVWQNNWTVSSSYYKSFVDISSVFPNLRVADLISSDQIT